MQVITMDRLEAEEYAPGTGHEAIISIRSPGGHRARLSTHFTDVLTLEFHDFETRHVPEVQLISDSQAREIADFLRRNISADRLIVHCEAGISRSVSTAAAIVDFLTYAAPNWTVYRSVMEALHADRDMLRGAPQKVQGPFSWHKAQQRLRRVG